jgi:hypothetical protein
MQKSSRSVKVDIEVDNDDQLLYRMMLYEYIILN